MVRQEDAPPTWRELGRWLRQTVVADRRLYIPKAAPFSLRRVAGCVWPNLHRPIFILGAPRSGTTFLGACLAQLPELSYHFEPVATKAAARYVYSGVWRAATARFFYRQVYAWLMRLHADGHLRFAEKTPQNCFVAPFLAEAFPDAQFIHILRDGRDAALSYSKQPWLSTAAKDSGLREPGGYLFGPYPRFWVEAEREEEFRQTTDIQRCIWAWRRHVEAALAGTRSLPADRYWELRYESLAREPQRGATDLLRFLGIAATPAHAPFEQALGRARTDMIGQWREELSAEQLRQIAQEAGPLLAQLGYTADTDR